MLSVLPFHAFQLLSGFLESPAFCFDILQHRKEYEAHQIKIWHRKRHHHTLWNHFGRIRLPPLFEAFYQGQHLILLF